MRTILISTFVATAALRQPVQAQSVESYRFDLGAAIGMSGYLGDANQSNMFHRPGAAGAIQGRYLFDDRWSLRLRGGVQSLSGNTADMSDALPGGTNYSFRSTVFDLTAGAEFNFFAYGIGEPYRHLSRWTPFVSAGAGVALSHGDGSSSGALCVPLGAGVRYKIAPRLNVAAEFTMTKVFGDHVDSSQLADLHNIKSSFIKNTDWYSTLTVGISYEIGPRCAECHRID